MANPDGNTLFADKAGKFKNLLIALTGEGDVVRLVDFLNIQDDQARNGHELFVFFLLGFVETDAACAEASMNAARAEVAEEFSNKRQLHEGFATGDGETAVFIKTQIALVMVPHFFDSNIFPLLPVPRIRVVTIGTTEGQPCKNSTMRTPGPSTVPIVSSE